MYLRLKSVWAVEMIQGIDGLFISLAIKNVNKENVHAE